MKGRRGMCWKKTMSPLGLRECILRKNCCSLNFVQIKMNVWTTGPHPYKMILFLQAGADRRGESWRLQSENTRRRRGGGPGGGEGGNWAHPWKRSVSLDFNIVLPKFDQIAVNADSDDVEKNKNGRNFHTHWVVLPLIELLQLNGFLNKGYWSQTRCKQGVLKSDPLFQNSEEGGNQFWI